MSMSVIKPATAHILHDYYSRMLTALGPSKWWPGETPFEVVLGAILTQNTAWTNVTMALQRLKLHCPLTPAHIWDLTDTALEECIRPSGFFRLKTQRIKYFLTFLARYEQCASPSHDTQLACFATIATTTLRAELLAVKGIGPETADSILLYALDRKSFVVDTYTRRILSRHGLIAEDVPYEELRSFFMNALPHDVALFNEYHALLVRIAKQFCHKARPLCALCPLNHFFTHESV